MFQAIFGKLDEFGCCNMDIIQTGSCAQFTSKDFHEGISIRGVILVLAEP